MDNQNTKMRAGEWLSSLIVLILVLMDNQNTGQKPSGKIRTARLNPCSNG